MATGGSGAVFFLGTRAHYQVLNQPESTYDAENGNASTETIYQDKTVQNMWLNKQKESNEMENNGFGNERGNRNYCDLNDTTVIDEKEIGSETSIRSKRSPSETALCEQDGDMKPAVLNALGDNNASPKSKPRSRLSVMAFLSSLGRRKQRLDTDQIQYLQHIESVLTTCTYRESCRCLECQSTYFDCDESDYSSDESDYTPRYIPQAVDETREDDEVFLDSAPDDNTSTDLLIDNDTKSERLENPEMSVSSDDGGPECLDFEVAAGTPVLLNYLLTHPITCVIQ